MLSNIRVLAIIEKLELINMNNETKERLTLRLFAGYKLTPPLRYALDQSKIWKDSRIDPRGELIEVGKQGSDYLGVYISSPSISIDKLKIVEEEIKLKLSKYCPDQDTSKFKLNIFSQLFIH